MMSAIAACERQDTNKVTLNNNHVHNTKRGFINMSVLLSSMASVTPCNLPFSAFRTNLEALGNYRPWLVSTTSLLEDLHW